MAEDLHASGKLPEDPSLPAVSRRSFLKGSAAAAAAGTTLTAAELEHRSTPRRLGAGRHKIQLAVNGKTQELEVETRTTLLDALRDQLDLTGTKKVCDRGSCGACTVLLDGEPVNSCLTLAVDAAGQQIQSIESQADGDRLSPLQEAFVRCDALQCGYCTPGMVMAAQACLDKHKSPDLPTIQRELSGNICRCGTYGRIFEAVQMCARGSVTQGRKIR